MKWIKVAGLLSLVLVASSCTVLGFATDILVISADNGAENVDTSQQQLFFTNKGLKQDAKLVKEWADDVLPRYGHGQVPPTGEKLKNWLHTMWLFDYLIYNVDRGTPNIMIATDWSPVVIDNSMTFNTFQTPIRPL
mgnify:CR=1 FL=1